MTAATINGGLTTVTLTLANGIANDQPQMLTVNGVRDTVGNLIAANTQVTIVVPGDFVRLQDSSTNHLLALEAEDFNRNLSPSGGNSWVFTNAPWLLQPTDANTNYSGSGVMLADPNLGNNRGSTPSGPELDYKVYFATAGTNYVWVRGVGDSAPGPSQNDSIMIGLDGALTTLLTGFPQGQGYSWGNTPVGASGPIVVNAPGLHVINVWMREDGFAFDKLLLSGNPSFNPAGIGPAESALIGPAIAVGHSGSNLVLSWTGPGTLQSATNVSGPYSDVLGAGNPFGVVPTGTQKFYRVRP